MLISDEYKDLNAQLHASRPDYGANGGPKWAETIVSIADAFGSADILDYGAGKCSLSRTLPVHNVKSYDPAIPGIDEPPAPADIVACLDVMEHIEPDLLDNVLDDLERVTKKAIVLVISTVPAVKTLADGRNAHLIQEPFKWWLDKLDTRFDLRQMNDIGSGFLVIMNARNKDA